MCVFWNTFSVICRLNFLFYEQILSEVEKAYLNIDLGLHI